MPKNHFDKIRQWFFWRREYPLFSEENLEPIVRSRMPNADELALGYAENKDEESEQPIKQLMAVPQSYRSTHFYIVGASGSGKSKFLETLILQDSKNGYGFGVIDAHSDLTENLKDYLLFQHIENLDFLKENVILIDPSDPDYTVCFNPLERTDGMDTDMVAGELMEVFKKIWSDSWGNRMAALLNNTLIALIENNLTLAELPPFLSDFKFRNMVLETVKNQSCRDYFFENFNRHSPNTQREWAESTLNKIGALLSNTKIRQMFISPKSTFSFREIMDKKKILLVKLDRGRLKGSADLLGSLILAKIQMTAFARTDTIQAERVPFYLYVDEFQNFATESFIETLAESRKYQLPLILAHQNLAQLPPALRASILTNCALQAYFRVSRADADMLAKESLTSIYNDPPGWEWYIQQLQELEPMICVIKNKIDGGVIKIQTLELPPAYKIIDDDPKVYAKAVSQAKIGEKYLRSRQDIEEEYQKRREELFRRIDTESFREKKKGNNDNEPIRYVPADSNEVI